MKKIVIAIMLPLLSVGAFSQIKVGVKGGLGYNFPSYKINADSITKPKTGGLGFTFGGFIDAPLGDGSVNFLGELLLTSRGYNTTIDETTTEEDITIRKEEYGAMAPMYLEIPLMFKFNMKMNTGKYGADNFLGFFAGPHFALKLSDGYYLERTTSVTVYEQETVVKEELKDSDIDYKPFDLGISAGIMHDWEMGLRVSLRYYRSLSPVNNNEEYGITHSGAMFTIGWNFIDARR